MGSATNAAALSNLGGASIAGNTFTGVQIVPTGSAAAPSLGFTGNTNTGFFQRAGGYIMAAFSGSERMHFSSSGIQIPSSSSFNFNSQDNTTAGGADLLLFRHSAGTLQLGQDSATVSSTPQRLQACNQISSNGAGAALTLSGGNGRGGAGGSLILATYSTAGSGVAGTLTTRLTINTLGEIIPVLPTSSAGLTTGALWNDTGTVKVA